MNRISPFSHYRYQINLDQTDNKPYYTYNPKLSTDFEKINLKLIWALFKCICYTKKSEHAEICYKLSYKYWWDIWTFYSWCRSFFLRHFWWDIWTFYSWCRSFFLRHFWWDIKSYLMQVVIWTTRKFATLEPLKLRLTFI